MHTSISKSMISYAYYVSVSTRSFKWTISDKFPAKKKKNVFDKILRRKTKMAPLPNHHWPKIIRLDKEHIYLAKLLFDVWRPLSQGIFFINSVFSLNQFSRRNQAQCLYLISFFFYLDRHCHKNQRSIGPIHILFSRPRAPVHFEWISSYYSSLLLFY